MSESTWKIKPAPPVGDWELPPAGNMAAVCVALIDMGTQQDAYMGKERDCHQLVIVWELAGMVSTKSGRNHLVCEKFNVSLHPKANLRKMLENWRGAPIRDDEEFDLYKIVGAACLLQVSHYKTNGGNDVYAIDAVTGLPRGMVRPSATMPLIKFRIEEGVESIPAQEWLPLVYGKKIGDVVRGCLEFRGREPATTTTIAAATNGASKPNMPAPSMDADIPF